jgi:hypothetical protein
MQITIDLPHVFNPFSTEEENAYALRILLESLVALNRAFLRKHAVPTLYASGVLYGRTTIWDTIPALYARRYGDCKSLSAALIAQYRERGIPAHPVFRFYKEASGKTHYHILVMRTLRGVTAWEDPSKRLGMGKDELRWFGLANQPTHIYSMTG